MLSLSQLTQQANTHPIQRCRITTSSSS